MYQITFTQNVKKVTVHVFLKRESSTELPGSLNFSTTDIFPVLSPVHTNSDKEPINWFHGCKNIKWTQARKVSPQNTKEKTIFLCLWVTLTLHTASYTFRLTENKYIWFEDSWENTNICPIVRMIWILLYRKNATPQDEQQKMSVVKGDHLVVSQHVILLYWETLLCKGLI